MEEEFTYLQKVICMKGFSPTTNSMGMAESYTTIITLMINTHAAYLVAILRKEKDMAMEPKNLK
jgi:hypothetical protein